MTARHDVSVAHYVRAVERRWSDLVERPVVLSRRDWSHLSRWHGWGVPLDLIAEELRSAVRPERGREPRGLAELASAIEESWSVILQGRIPRHALEPGSVPVDPRASWSDRILQEPAESPLAQTLTDLLARLDRGDDPHGLEQELDRRLPEIAPAELVQRVLASLDRELAGYRSRMPTEQLQTTRRRACEKRLREALKLPRLARTPAAE